MKNTFKTYNSYTKTEYDNIWSNCIFVIDTNVLLNLYRYTEETRRELLQILNRLQDRLWIPHQVGLEYHSNKDSVILEQIDAFGQITRSLNTASDSVVSELTKGFKNFNKRHPSINLNTIIKDIRNYFDNLTTQIDSEKKKHPDLLKNDNILEKLNALLNNKVGPAYDQKTLDAIFKEGSERYKNEFPPGYKDQKDKEGLLKFHNELVIKSEYGDLIVWKQIIDKAKEEKKPVIFITDDVKEDWWKIVRGRTLGPRTELINEFMLNTNQQLLMYNTERFIEYASEVLKKKVNIEAIKEIQDLSEANKNEEDLRKIISQKAKTILYNLEDRKNEPYLQKMSRINKDINRSKNEQYFMDLYKNEQKGYNNDLNALKNKIVLHEIHTTISQYISPGDDPTTAELKRIIRGEVFKYLDVDEMKVELLEDIVSDILDELIQNGFIRRFYADDKVKYIVIPF